jgi:hypothetical protein
MFYFCSSFLAGLINIIPSISKSQMLVGLVVVTITVPTFCAVCLGVLSAQSQSSLPTSRPVYRPYKGTHVTIYIKSLWVFGVGI